VDSCDENKVLVLEVGVFIAAGIIFNVAGIVGGCSLILHVQDYVSGLSFYGYEIGRAGDFFS